jgi:uracil-DNA glycosylase
LDIRDLCDEIRKCTFCFDTPPELVPFVYLGADPKVLVVSEIPAVRAWEQDIGASWERGELFAPLKNDKKKESKGAPHTLCKWLGKDESWARSQLFWIQRANCVVPGKRFAFQHCSGKFLDRAIDLVQPRLILILGGVAAEFFCRRSFKKLSELMGQAQKYVLNEKSYNCVVLYHTSRRITKLRKSNKLHNDSVKLARQMIMQL